MKKTGESTRRFIVESKVPLGFVVLVGGGTAVFYFFSEKSRPQVAMVASLLGVALAAGLTAALLGFLHSMLSEGLPRVWKNLMGGFGAFAVAAGFCLLGALIGWYWAEGRLERLLWVVTFTAVLLVYTFGSGFRRASGG